MPSSYQSSWEWQNGDESQEGKLIDWLPNRRLIIFISFRGEIFPFALNFIPIGESIDLRLNNKVIKRSFQSFRGFSNQEAFTATHSVEEKKSSLQCTQNKSELQFLIQQEWRGFFLPKR